jgi:hypothetical protein
MAAGEDQAEPLVSRLERLSAPISLIALDA